MAYQNKPRGEIQTNLPLRLENIISQLPPEFSTYILEFYPESSKTGAHKDLFFDILEHSINSASSPEFFYLHLERSIEYIGKEKVIQIDVNNNLINLCNKYKTIFFENFKVEGKNIQELYNLKNEYIEETKQPISELGIKRAYELFESVILIEEILDREIIGFSFTHDENNIINLNITLKIEEELRERGFTEIEISNVKDILRQNADLLEKLVLLYKAQEDKFLDYFSENFISQLTRDNLETQQISLLNGIINSKDVDKEGSLDFFNICLDKTNEFFKNNEGIDKKIYFTQVLIYLFNSYLEDKNIDEAYNDLINENNINKILNPTKIFSSTSNKSDKWKELEELFEGSFAVFNKYFTLESEKSYEILAKLFFLNYAELNQDEKYKSLLKIEDLILIRAAEVLIIQTENVFIEPAIDEFLNKFLPLPRNDFISGKKKDIYEEIKNYFEGKGVISEQKQERFFHILSLSEKTLVDMGIETNSKDYKRALETAFMFWTIETSLHEKSGNEINYYTQEGAAATILRKIINFDLNNNSEFGRETSLAIYYFNRKGLGESKNNSISEDSKPFYLNLAFNANMLAKLQIDIGKYTHTNKDCYDALVALIVFWYYDFQVENKEELQAVFDYIFSSDKGTSNRDTRLKNNKDLFLQVVARSIDYHQNVLLQGEVDENSISRMAARLAVIYYLVEPANSGNEIKERLNKNYFSKLQGGFSIDINGKTFNFDSENKKKVADLFYWWIYTSSLNNQLNTVFYQSPKKETWVNLNDSNLIENIFPGILIRSSKSHLTGSGQHNFLFVLNENGEVIIVDYGVSGYSNRFVYTMVDIKEGDYTATSLNNTKHTVKKSSLKFRESSSSSDLGRQF